jgi:hypothetical protein
MARCLMSLGAFIGIFARFSDGSASADAAMSITE